MPRDTIQLDSDVELLTDEHDGCALSLNTTFSPRTGGVSSTKVFCHDHKRMLTHHEVKASSWPA